jgi:hypothetical protein
MCTQCRYCTGARKLKSSSLIPIALLSRNRIACNIPTGAVRLYWRTSTVGVRVRDKSFEGTSKPTTPRYIHVLPATPVFGRRDLMHRLPLRIGTRCRRVVSGYRVLFFRMLAAAVLFHRFINVIDSLDSRWRTWLSYASMVKMHDEYLSEGT